ncbi:energy transducer TonB [Bacteroidales bacterium OttesenSCG-928-B11]|nr:energy transducer TonB [Bacteroidales bacterium OttesenSCG-928-E04]MDL2311771.1 energy transducer TonB [Bacteroidales bacterium OttesenSCG-928-B11]MDL2325477.1 energy transducer TonB [Bacteroidales bacterium OttesenSCG-928-A14]
MKNCNPLKKIPALFAFLFCGFITLNANEVVTKETATIEDHFSFFSVDDDTTKKESLDKTYSPPKFPGGLEALYAFMGKNLEYPQKAVDQNIEGMVILEFVVTKEGNVDEARIYSSTNDVFNEEALRLAAIMPQWTPAIHNGKPVKSYYQLPMQFKFEGKAKKGKKKRN